MLPKAQNWCNVNKIGSLRPSGYNGPLVNVGDAQAFYLFIIDFRTIVTSLVGLCSAIVWS